MIDEKSCFLRSGFFICGRSVPVIYPAIAETRIGFRLSFFPCKAKPYFSKDNLSLKKVNQFNLTLSRRSEGLSKGVL